MKVLNLLSDIFILSWFLTYAIIFIVSGEISKITIICSFIVTIDSYIRNVVKDYRSL